MKYDLFQISHLRYAYLLLKKRKSMLISQKIFPPSASLGTQAGGWLTWSYGKREGEGWISLAAGKHSANMRPECDLSGSSLLRHIQPTPMPRIGPFLCYLLAFNRPQSLLRTTHEFKQKCHMIWFTFCKNDLQHGFSCCVKNGLYRNQGRNKDAP